MISKLCIFTLLYFGLISNIFSTCISTRKILRNIMRDSETITINQNVRFQGRMPLENSQLDHIQNGRLSAIIKFNMPNI